MYRPQHRPAQFETSLTVNHPAFTVHCLAFFLRPCERASEVAPPFAHARIDHEGIRFRRNLLQQASDRAERNFQNDAECRALTRRTERMVQFLRRSGFPSRDSVTGLGHDVAVDRKPGGPLRRSNGTHRGCCILAFFIAGHTVPIGV